jgi:hypothetical protein
MADAPDFLKKLARGVAAARAVVGSDLVAESLPVAIGNGLARPVIERRRKRGDGMEKLVLVLPFGEGEVRIELTPAEYEALTREMVRFWNAQGETPAPPATT